MPNMKGGGSTLIRTIHRIFGVLIHPISTFQTAKEDGYSLVALYAITLISFNAICTTLWSNRPGSIDAALFSPSVIFAFPFILWFIIISGFTLFLHGAVKMGGGGEGIRYSLITVVYGFTPFILTSWFLGISGWMSGMFELFFFFVLLFGASANTMYIILFSLWSLILMFYAVKELQGIPIKSAFISVAGAAVVFLIIVAFLSLVGFAILWGLGMPHASRLP